MHKPAAPEFPFFVELGDGLATAATKWPRRSEVAAFAGTRDGKEWV